MNIDFYIFGSPNNKYDQFRLDSNSELFREFAQNRQSDIELIVYRKNQLIYYTYLRYGLLSEAHLQSAYLGMSMVFNGVSFNDVKGIYELFEELFSSMVLKGEIVKQYEKGKIAFTVDKFIKKQAEIKECRAFLQRTIEKQFSQAEKDYTILDTSFVQTNFTVKTLSLNSGNSDITNAVHKFQHIVLASQNAPVPVREKYKWEKWVLSLLVIAIMTVSIILVMRNVKHDNMPKGQRKMHYPIAGKYLCNIEYPLKVRLKIEISVDSITNKCFGQFINYGYRDTLFASEFIINAEGTKVSNATLGEGSIIKNSMGEIEIISKPENAKKWNMRKMQ